MYGNCLFVCKESKKMFKPSPNKNPRLQNLGCTGYVIAKCFVFTVNIYSNSNKLNKIIIFLNIFNFVKFKFQTFIKNGDFIFLIFLSFCEIN